MSACLAHVVKRFQVNQDDIWNFRFPCICLFFMHIVCYYIVSAVIVAMHSVMDNRSWVKDGCKYLHCIINWNLVLVAKYLFLQCLRTRSAGSKALFPRMHLFAL